MATASMKKCPYCAQMIPLEALFCHLCRRDFGTPESVNARLKSQNRGTLSRDLTLLAIIIGFGALVVFSNKGPNDSKQLINSLPDDVQREMGRLLPADGLERNFAQAVRGVVEIAAELNRTKPDPKTLATIDAIIKKEEHTGPYIYGQGNGYLANKQYDLAIQKFDEAISLGHTDSYYVRGIAWLEKHEYEHAIADFTQALKVRSDHFVYNYRAQAYEQKGDRESAIADYRQALALNPDENTKKQITAALNRLALP